MDLFELYLQYDGNDDQFLELKRKFFPLIKKYQYQVPYHQREDYYQDCYMFIHRLFYLKSIHIDRSYYLPYQRKHILKRQYELLYIFDKNYISTILHFQNYHQYCSYKISFRNFVGSIRILNYMQKVISNMPFHYRSKEELISLNNHFKNNLYEYIDIIEDKENFLPNFLLEDILSFIHDPIDQKIILLKMKGYQQNEIARILHLSCQAISKRVEKIKKVLSKKLF